MSPRIEGSTSNLAFSSDMKKTKRYVANNYLEELAQSQFLPPVTSPRTLDPISILNAQSRVQSPNKLSGESPKKLISPKASPKNSKQQQRGKEIVADEDSQEEGIKEEVKLAGPVLEEWLNEVLKPSEDSDQMVPKEVKAKANQYRTPSQAYGIDMNSLLQNKISIANAKRIQRSLYVHSVGFHQQLKENVKGCQNRIKVLHNIWISYQALLEHCLKTSHNTLIANVTDLLQKEIDQLKVQHGEDMLAEEKKRQSQYDELTNLRNQHYTDMDKISVLEMDIINLQH